MDIFAQYKLSDDDVIKAHTLYWEQVCIEDPSPNLVEDFLAGLKEQGLINSPLASPTGLYDISEEGEVYEESHEDGVNDLVSGALSRRDEARATPLKVRAMKIMEEGDDTTVCERHWELLTTTMPQYMISRRSLRSSDAFKDPSTAYQLPEEFHTTMRGMQLAQDDACDAAGSNDPEDDLILAALLKRGGVPKEDAGDIIYPEDLVPIIGPEDEKLHDKEYWDEIKALKVYGLEDAAIEEEDEAKAHESAEASAASKTKGKQKKR